MQTFQLGPVSCLASVWRNRQLCVALIRREVVGRYRGSMLGLFWSLFNPVLMLLVYTFVFSVIFKQRWSQSLGESQAEFALILFAGLMVFNLFAECVNRAPGLVLSQANYVKKVVFPLEILPWVSLGSAIFHTGVSLLVWGLFYCVLVGGLPPWTALLFPIILLPVVGVVMGLSWFLAALGVYVRDVSQVVGLLVTVLMFLSPIFYPVTAIPEEYREVLQLNPLTISIEQARMILIGGAYPDLPQFTTQLLVSFVVASLGYAWFQKTRKGFADVI